MIRPRSSPRYSTCLHPLESQLTKRARLGGDSETRRKKRPKRGDSGKSTGLLPSLREPLPHNIGHFERLHTATLLTRKQESSKSVYLAPLTGQCMAISPVSDVFAIQDEISRGIVNSLRLR